MITLTVEKDWTGKYTFIVSNGFDSQSLTPGTFVVIIFYSKMFLPSLTF